MCPACPKVYHYFLYYCTTLFLSVNLSVLLCTIINISLQDGGTVICAMDAVFGLPRKKSAGISHRDPLHEDLFFCQQSTVDQFVAENDQKRNVSTVSCIHVYESCVSSS